MKPSMNTTKYLSFHPFSVGQKMFRHLGFIWTTNLSVVNKTQPSQFIVCSTEQLQLLC